MLGLLSQELAKCSLESLVALEGNHLGNSIHRLRYDNAIVVQSKTRINSSN